ncbi:hypothetical protein [Streptomyces echinatus]|uniref:Uncharacterized protein n=1 Tax=Streptomyces echinatus TaxID=67293 RepID=A0A7W9PTP3_9ACTN|nr:hypothetical protein [Streptomyces echinatus]MBB5927268.1 hypothetical protein [Streptomyces echinatus]
MSTGPGRLRRVRPAVAGTVAAPVLPALTYAVFFAAARLRTEPRGAELTAVTFHDGACLRGG